MQKIRKVIGTVSLIVICCYATSLFFYDPFDLHGQFDDFVDNKIISAIDFLFDDSSDEILKNGTCSSLGEGRLVGQQFTNVFGAKWKVLKISKEIEISRTETSLVCKAFAQTSRGDFNVDYSLKTDEDGDAWFEFSRDLGEDGPFGSKSSDTDGYSYSGDNFDYGDYDDFGYSGMNDNYEYP